VPPLCEGPEAAAVLAAGPVELPVLKARLWFVHKGIEKLFHQCSVAAGLPLAERISGDTAVGHALAYCLAVEEATGIPVPEQARCARALRRVRGEEGYCAAGTN
jgi:hypothetical protein